MPEDTSPIEASNPKLSIFELSPVLVPYFIGFFVFRGIFVNFPIYLQITQNLTEIVTVEKWAIISGIALLVGAISRLPTGLISDKIGRLKAFALAYSIYFIALIIVILTTTDIMYIIAMSMIRFGLNFIAMTGRAVVSSALRDRALKNGMLSSMVGLGSFTGPYLLGYVLDHFSPNIFLFVTLAFVFLDLILFFILFISVSSIMSKKNHTPDLNYEAVDTTQRIDYLAALQTDGVKEIFFLFFSAGMVFGLISSIYSIYGYNVIGLSVTFIGLITGAGSLVQTVWAPITGRLYLYFKDEHLRVFAWFFIMLAGISASLSFWKPGFFIASFFILNFGNSSYFTVEITRMSKLVKEGEFSLIFGIATSLIILGTSIAGFISYHLYKIIAEANFFVAVGFGTLSLGIVISTMKKWSHKRYDNSFKE